MSRAEIQAAFPRLRRTQFYITSPGTIDYNCIAWAAGDDSRCWWPFPPPYAYWPGGIERKVELRPFVEVFATLGYEECADGALEPGYEKIALFVDSNGNPTHAARQLSNGSWTSKLGPHEDIRHSIYGLEQGYYGNVGRFLRRHVSPPAQPRVKNPPVP